jgi:hypothetical protein
MLQPQEGKAAIVFKNRPAGILFCPVDPGEIKLEPKKTYRVNV